MRRTSGRIFFLVILPACLAAVLFWIFGPFPHGQRGPGQQPNMVSAAPVEVAPIEHGTIELLRTFSGALEPRAEFVVAPKVGGRVERLTVNIADSVKRGELVGELDNGEYIQAVALAVDAVIGAVDPVVRIFFLASGFSTGETGAVFGWI